MTDLTPHYPTLTGLVKAFEFHSHPDTEAAQAELKTAGKVWAARQAYAEALGEIQELAEARLADTPEDLHTEALEQVRDTAKMTLMLPDAHHYHAFMQYEMLVAGAIAFVQMQLKVALRLAGECPHCKTPIEEVDCKTHGLGCPFHVATTLKLPVLPNEAEPVVPVAPKRLLALVGELGKLMDAMEASGLRWSHSGRLEDLSSAFSSLI